MIERRRVSSSGEARSWDLVFTERDCQYHVPLLCSRTLWCTELARWAFEHTCVCEMASSQVLTPEMPKNLLGAAETDAGDVHVLAVDDSVIDRRVLENLLKTSAYKVTAVDSGRKALEILGVGEALGPVSFSVSPNSCSISPDTNTSEKCALDEVNLIITDYCMPGMTGYDLLKKVKGTSALKGIPVVVMSSENEPNRISSCLAEGAEEFLLKPVQLADVERLRGHVRHPQGMVASEQDPSCPKRRVIVESTPVRSLERRVQRVCHLS